MLFKGVVFDKKWVTRYHNRVGTWVKFPGLVSVSKNLKIALNFAQCDQEPLPDGKTPVVFIILVRNYYSFEGLTLASPMAAAFSQDDDYILKEGIEYFVLSVQKDFEIRNKIR